MEDDNKKNFPSKDNISGKYVLLAFAFVFFIAFLFFKTKSIVLIIFIISMCITYSLIRGNERSNSEAIGGGLIISLFVAIIAKLIINFASGDFELSPSPESKKLQEDYYQSLQNHDYGTACAAASALKAYYKIQGNDPKAEEWKKNADKICK